MVVLTIVTQTNGETFYFYESIPKVDFMKLISCSLFNSWYTLTKEVGTSLFDDQDNVSFVKFPPGHYNIESLSKEIKDMLTKYDYELETETNTPLGIHNWTRRLMGY